jgi:hypothetical protein
MIDWRAYARNDQLIVREDRQPAAVRVNIFLDLRQSMNWPEENMRGVSNPPKKSTLALNMALNMAYRHLRDQDLINLLILAELPNSQGVMVKIRDLSDLRALHESLLLGELANLSPLESQDDFGNVICDVSYIISDCLSGLDGEQWLDVFARQCPSGRTAFLHLLSSLELDTGWLSGAEIYYEQGVLVEYRGTALLEHGTYGEKLKSWLALVEGRMAAQGFYYVLFSDLTPLSSYFDFFPLFLSRQRGMK